MELCSIEDAFPNIEMGVPRGGSGKGSGFPFVGGTDDRPTKEERRAARKKAKRCKTMSPGVAAFAQDIPDPDRPAMFRMKAVEAFQGSGSSGGGARSLEEEDPGAEAGGGEPAVHYPTPLAKQAPKIPVLPKASCLISDPGYPAYFGRGEDDDEGFQAAPFSAVVAGKEDASYMLQTDFTKSFEFKGAQKAAGAVLAQPNIDDSWKPMAPAASYTAFVADGQTGAEKGWALTLGEPVAVPGGAAAAAAEKQRHQRPAAAAAAPAAASDLILPAGGNKAEDKDALLARINTLAGRLEMLEKKKTQDTQTELLAFVGTGLFLLLAMEIAARR